jgi:hypothetical protein
MVIYLLSLHLLIDSENNENGPGDNDPRKKNNHGGALPTKYIFQISESRLKGQLKIETHIFSNSPIFSSKELLKGRKQTSTFIHLYL